MVKEKKITEADIQKGLAKGKKIPEIAEEYGVTPITVLKMVQKMEREGKRVRPTPGIFVNPKKFDLQVGDIITAIESEVSKIRQEYVIVHIDEVKYIGEKLTGGKWKVTFLVDDYGTAHDSNQVRRKPEEEKIDRWKRGRDY